MIQNTPSESLNSTQITQNVYPKQQNPYQAPYVAENQQQSYYTPQTAIYAPQNQQYYPQQAHSSQSPQVYPVNVQNPAQYQPYTYQTTGIYPNNQNQVIIKNPYQYTQQQYQQQQLQGVVVQNNQQQQQQQIILPEQQQQQQSDQYCYLQQQQQDNYQNQQQPNNNTIININNPLNQELIINSQEEKIKKEQEQNKNNNIENKNEKQYITYTTVISNDPQQQYYHNSVDPQKIYDNPKINSQYQQQQQFQKVEKEEKVKLQESSNQNNIQLSPKLPLDNGSLLQKKSKKIKKKSQENIQFQQQSQNKNSLQQQQSNQDAPNNSLQTCSSLKNINLDHSDDSAKLNLQQQQKYIKQNNNSNIIFKESLEFQPQLSQNLSNGQTSVQQQHLNQQQQIIQNMDSIQIPQQLQKQNSSVILQQQQHRIVQEHRILIDQILQLKSEENSQEMETDIGRQNLLKIYQEQKQETYLQKYFGQPQIQNSNDLELIACSNSWVNEYMVNNKRIRALLKVPKINNEYNNDIDTMHYFDLFGHKNETQDPKGDDEEYLKNRQKGVKYDTYNNKMFFFNCMPQYNPVKQMYQTEDAIINSVISSKTNSKFSCVNRNKCLLSFIMNFFVPEHLIQLNLTPQLRTRILQIVFYVQDLCGYNQKRRTFKFSIINHVHYRLMFLKITKKNIEDLQKNEQDVKYHMNCFGLDLGQVFFALSNKNNVENSKKIIQDMKYVNFLKKCIHEIMIEHIVSPVRFLQKGNNCDREYEIRAFEKIAQMANGEFINRF